MDNDKNLQPLKEFGNAYFQNLFRPKPKVIPDVKYSKNDLQIAKRIKDGSTYTLDLREACRILVLGATRCMPLGTLVRTKDGVVKIEDAKKVLSYNLRYNVVQEKECVVHSNQKCKIAEIHTIHGEVMKCSHNHKWIVLSNGKIRKVETKKLTNKDSLMNVEKKDWVRIKKICLLDEEVEMVDLAVDDNENFILENNLLTSNSGKTFFMRSIADRLYQTGRDVLLLSDVKNEFFSSLEPVQEKFRNGLLKGETPKALPVVTLRPTFFRKITPTLPKHNFWYSVDISSLSKADFLTMMNADELTSTQRIAMDLIFDELKKELDKGKKFSIELVEDIIMSIDEISTLQKNALKFKFRPLKESGFIDEKYERSIVALLQHPRRYVPAINMEHFDSFGKGSFRFPEVIMNVALREVIEARMRNKINPLWVFLDESSRFVGNRVSGSFKHNVLESIDLHTRYSVNYVLISQTIEDVASNILKQCKYIFIPATADVGTIKTVLTETGMVKNQQIAPNTAMRLKRMMQKVKFSWIILNRMDGTMELVKPLSPLSQHLETSQ